HYILSFYSLKNVCYIIQCACVASLSLFFAFAPLLTLCFFSHLLRQKRNYTILKCVTDNLHFLGVQLRFKCPINCLKTCAFYSIEEGVGIVVFLTKSFVCLLSLLTNFFI